MKKINPVITTGENMIRKYSVILICILSLTACDTGVQRGLFGQDSQEQIDADEAAAEAVTNKPVEVEFELMPTISQQDLDAAADFIVLREARDAVKESLKKHPRQSLRTGLFLGGVAVSTSEKCAYWYKDGTLYNANPFARAYSPELRDAPPEINERELIEASIADPNAEQNEADLIAQQYADFLGLVHRINEELTEGVDTYSTEFMAELTSPVSDDLNLKTIEKFRQILDTFKQDDALLYAELDIDDSLSIYTFGRVEKDMSVAQATRILGQGKVLEEHTSGNDTFTLHTWSTSAVGGLYLFFRNDRMFKKLKVDFN